MSMYIYSESLCIGYIATGWISHGASRRPWCSSVSGIEVPAYKYTVVLDRNAWCDSISVVIDRFRCHREEADHRCLQFNLSGGQQLCPVERSGGKLAAGTVLRKSSRWNTRIVILKWIIYKYRCTVVVKVDGFLAFNHTTVNDDDDIAVIIILAIVLKTD